MNDIIDRATAVLSTTPARWTSIAQGLPLELLNGKPASREWSAMECLQHLVDVEPVFLTRLQSFLAGRDFPAHDPDTQGTILPEDQSPIELVEEFSRLREASLAALGKITPGDLGQRVRHAELGPVTLDEMLHEWAGHDLMHTVQAERALMQPFIRGCGPWLKYFKDHFRSPL